MDYTVLGILQARILEWVAFPFSRASSQPRDRTQVSCIAGRFFTSWALLLLLSHLSHVRLCATRGQQPTRLLCPQNSLGKSTGVGCHFLLQAEPQGDLIKSLISELNIRMSSGAWDSVLFLQEALVQNLDASCLFCLYFVRNMTAQKLREPNLRELVLSSQDHPILTQKKPDL